MPAFAFVFEHGIGGRRRAVKDIVDLGWIDIVGGTEFEDTGHDATRGVVWCRGDLVNGHVSVGHVAIDQIGKGTADIHADGFHHALRVLSSN
jgi:hypothetical protein